MNNVKALISLVLETDESEIDDSFSQADSDRWDSLNHLRLMSVLEEEYIIEFDEKEIDNAKSYGDIIALLKIKGVKL